MILKMNQDSLVVEDYCLRTDFYKSKIEEKRIH